MPIYTKRGDKGETSLYYKTKEEEVRISKTSLRVEAIGTTDELNSFLGIAKTQIQNKRIKDIVHSIQLNLFTINSIIAGADLNFSVSETTKLEKLIDDMDKVLPRLSNFIIPGGSYESSLMHSARSLSRRAERRVVAVNQIEKLKPSVLTYINRLSDTFFTLARYANFCLGVEDEKWRTN